MPVAIPASESTHHNNLTEEEAAVLPPLKETSDLTQATPGSTAVVGGVASLPAEEGTTSRAGPIAEQPPAAEPGIAGGAVLPQEAGAAHEREAAPVYEKPTSTVGGEQLDGQAASPSIGASEGSIQKDAPLSYESEAPVASSEAATSAVASPAASSLKAPETETAAAPGSALEAPLSSKPSPKKAVSFKEDSLPPVSAIAAETPAVAEKDAEPHTSSTAEIPPATTEPHAAEEAPESILLTPIQETNLTKSGGSLEDAAPAESGYLSSADISEMPGIGRSIPATPEAEAGSVLVGGAEEPKTLTKPEEQIIDSQEQALSASKSQGNYAQEQVSSYHSRELAVVVASILEEQVGRIIPASGRERPQCHHQGFNQILKCRICPPPAKAPQLHHPLLESHLPNLQSPMKALVSLPFQSCLF